MLLVERPEFEAQIKILMAAFDRTATTERLEAYWLGLQDAKLSEVTRRVAELCKAAKKGRPVPRPAELRKAAPESEEPQQHPQRDADLAAAQRLNAQTWQEFERADPQLHRIEIGIARACRILASDRPSSPAYAQAMLEDRQLRDERTALWRARAGLPP